MEILRFQSCTNLLCLSSLKGWVRDSAFSRSNMGSRARLRTLSESIDRSIRTRRSWRSGGYSVHTFGRGRLPDLVSFSSKLAWIRDIFSHQVGLIFWREMRNKPLKRKHSSLWTLWDSSSMEHIFPINLEGFLSAAKVRDMNSWYLWKGLRVCSSVRCSLRDS